MTLRAFDGAHEIARSSMVIAEVLPALVAPVCFVYRNLVYTRYTLNFLRLLLSSLVHLIGGLINDLVDPFSTDTEPNRQMHDEPTFAGTP